MYISGQALVILGGPHNLLQTIYVDDTQALEAVAIDGASGRIAVCGGPYAFVYEPYGTYGETLKVCGCAQACWSWDMAKLEDIAKMLTFWSQ